MQYYQSHKLVQAARIEGITEVLEGLKLALAGGGEFIAETAVYARYVPVVGDYLVKYPPAGADTEPYYSISPRDAFESGYKQLPSYTGFLNFGGALDALKAGHRVARAGWNGKGMFLFLVPGSRFAVNRAPLLGIYPEGTMIDYHPHIDMKTAQGYVVPWLASQADMLACDWLVVEDQPQQTDAV